MHPMLNTAIKAARKVGSIIQRGARDLDLLTVTTKGPKDFVSEVDKAAEAAMKQPANQRLVTLAGPTGLIDFVKQRGISEDKAKQCLADSKAADALVAKVQEGAKQYDITGTPTFILNGKVVDGVASWELLRTKLTEAGL